MKDVSEEARIQICKRNINQLGDTNSHLGLVNNEELLLKMGRKVLLVSLLGKIEASKMVEAKKKKKSETSELIVNAPAAKAKLAAKGGDVTKITIKGIFSLLLACSKGHISKSASKPAMVQLLYAKIQD